MNRYKFQGIFLFFSCLTLFPIVGFTQISSVVNAFQTEYSSGSQDNVYVFCGEKGELNASLTASYPQGETGNFEWLKYNSTTGTFDAYSSDQSGNQTSTISNLADGCYRVKITPASGAKMYTAWVLYMKASAEISQSDCSSLTLNGTFEPLTYTDLSTGQPKVLAIEVAVEWSAAGSPVSHVMTSIIIDPPTKNTTYTFTINDRFGCTAQATVEYVSIVTKASFTYALKDQGKGSNSGKIEAPATFTFTNTSENASSYEWYFFKPLALIKAEKDAGTFKDSIQDIIYSENAVYTYEASGSYRVKLITKKTTGSTTCTDTYYIDDYIKVDTSFIDAPNLFMPEKLNSSFAVMFFSMKSVKITIANRWGKVLHVWENNNLQGFYNTAETVPQSVWDGKVGGKYATPGVYFWVAEGIGRDGVRRKENGFFHLFRDK
jgi:hypothetical protein